MCYHILSSRLPVSSVPRISSLYSSYYLAREVGAINRVLHTSTATIERFVGTTRIARGTSGLQRNEQKCQLPGRVLTERIKSIGDSHQRILIL